MSVFAFAQDIPQSEVPSIILNAFKQHFPKASGIEWERKGEMYEAEFKIGTADYEVFYNSSGKLMRVKNDIAESELPAVVSSAIKKDFPGYRIKDLEKIDEQGVVTYKMELKKLNEEWDVVYDASGKLLSKVAD